MSAIIDRIKKLLRLGADQRGNAHEAERAMGVTVKPLKNRHNENAVTAGWIDGKATNISQPLGGGKQDVLALR